MAALEHGCPYDPLSRRQTAPPQVGEVTSLGRSLAAGG